MYHILNKVPAIEKYDMQLEYEELAQELFNSGRLRIDTGYQCNFARYTDSVNGGTLIVSKTEITEHKLINKTKQLIAFLYKDKINNTQLDNKIASIIQHFEDQIKRLIPVSEVTAIKIARLIVQSAHPIVIKWLIHDNVEVFVTYSHSIGDMMDIQNWKKLGQNSGMQSTNGKDGAIFISCGGDPFADNDKRNPTFGDGWPAIARLQIIASQELGHFADILRDEQGRQISRHSANFSGTKANDQVKIARKKDIERCVKLSNKLNSFGLDKLTICEEKLKFYQQHRPKSVKVLFFKIIQFCYRYKILLQARRCQILFIKQFAKDRYMSATLKAIINDMKSNLAPTADVYMRQDLEEQEAIACIEALARVPQQAIKWGHLATLSLMSNLYDIYYNQVVKTLITNYSSLHKKAYVRDLNMVNKPFTHIIRNLFKTHKDEKLLQSVRDL